MRTLKARGPMVITEGIDRDPKKHFKSFGEFAAAVVNASIRTERKDYRLEAMTAAYKKLAACTDSKGNAAEMSYAAVKAASGMNLGVSSEGGFLVPDGFAADLMKSTYDRSQVAGRAWNILSDTEILHLPCTVETSRADGSRQGGVQSYWKAEAAQATSSKPGFGELKMRLEKLFASTYFTEETSHFSYQSLEGYLTRIFSDEFAFKLDDGIVNGTGAGQLLGILKAPALVTVAKEAGQIADTIVAENIVTMFSRLPAWSYPNAVWLINQDVLPQLLAISTALNDSGLFSFADGQLYLIGRPVVICEQCAALGDLGDIILADLSEYILATESTGMAGSTSIHVRFDYAENCMRWTLFVDGMPWPQAPITPYKGALTQSPFVTLAARA